MTKEGYATYNMSVRERRLSTRARDKRQPRETDRHRRGEIRRWSAHKHKSCAQKHSAACPHSRHSIHPSPPPLTRHSELLDEDTQGGFRGLPDPAVSALFRVEHDLGVVAYRAHLTRANPINKKKRKRRKQAKKAERGQQKRLFTNVEEVSGAE